MGPDLHFRVSPAWHLFSGTETQNRCQEELQFAGEKGKVSCVSWEERNLVLRGGLTLGSLVLGSSSGRLSSPCLLPEPWFRTIQVLLAITGPPLSPWLIFLWSL